MHCHQNRLRLLCVLHLKVLHLLHIVHSGTSSSATGGRPRLISLDISSTSRKNPSDINSAVSAVTDPGLMFNVRAIFALAILPDARTSSKIC